MGTRVKPYTKVPQDELRRMLVDVDRMSMIYNHALRGLDHVLTIKMVSRHSDSSSGTAFIQIECMHPDCLASHDGEPWWDEWDFEDTYTAFVQSLLGLKH